MVITIIVVVARMEDHNGYMRYNGNNTEQLVNLGDTHLNSRFQLGKPPIVWGLLKTSTASPILELHPSCPWSRGRTCNPANTLFSLRTLNIEPIIQRQIMRRDLRCGKSI